MKKILFTLCILLTFTACGNTDTANLENKYTQDDLYFLTEALYFEARDQDFIGKMAVGLVIRNRVNSPRYANTFKEVIHEKNWVPKHKKYVCAFSYYCDGRSDKMTDTDSMVQVETVARIILSNPQTVIDFTSGADLYYNPSLAAPTWSRSQCVINIGMYGEHRVMKQISYVDCGYDVFGNKL